MQSETTPQKLSNDSMRRSEIESKYAQFVQVNERLLRFIKGEEGPDEEFEECQSTFVSLLNELLSGLTLYSGLSLFTPEQQEYILSAKKRTFHPRHRRGLTRARSRSRSRAQSESRASSISSESTSFQSSSSITMPTPEEIAAAQKQKEEEAVAEATRLLKVKLELEEASDEAEIEIQTLKLNRSNSPIKLK